MQKYNCIIVEDEPIAADILKDYISQVPYLHLKEVFIDAISAMELLQKERIELIFLDIHLPKLKGIDFLKTLKNPPGVIITTAYQEYALQGFEHSVLDFLLKPIEFSRFLIALNKFRMQMETRPLPTLPDAVTERAYLYFTVNKKKVKVFLDEILYIESQKEYIRIFTPNRNFITKLQLGQVEELLANNNFLRIHRSFIVAKGKVEAFSATDVEIAGKEIPIGRNYKEHVLRALE